MPGKLSSASAWRNAVRTVVLLAFLSCAWLSAAQQSPLTHVESIVLPEVVGRIDHMDVDVERNRLFIAALGNDSPEVVDIERHRHLRHIAGLREPQGVRFVPAAGRLFVANGRSGTVDVFSGDALDPVATIQGLADADNVRSDSGGQVYVGYDGGLAVIDPRTARVVTRIALAGHPESLQIDQAGARIYANLPSVRQVVAVGREAGTVQAKWRLNGVQSNYPMALDDEQHKLFVASRRPATLLVFDTDSGREVARLPTCGDSDDLFFDRKRRQLYVICGEGEVEVLRQEAADRYVALGRVKTRPGARTGLYVPSRDSLYVAAPARSGAPAAIMVYRVS